MSGGAPGPKKNACRSARSQTNPLVSNHPRHAAVALSQESFPVEAMHRIWGWVLSEVCRRILSVDIATLAIVVLGLGGLSGLPGGDAEAPRSNEPRSAPEKGEASSPRPSCFAGSMWLGPREGAIHFRARCRPTAPSGTIDVAVSRVTLAETQLVPLRAFQRFPLLKGTGAVRRGRCVRERRTHGQILCGAKVKGSAVLEGRIWVRADERCESNIQLVSGPSYEPCRGVCTAVLTAPTLIVSGLPRGC